MNTPAAIFLFDKTGSRTPMGFAKAVFLANEKLTK